MDSIDASGVGRSNTSLQHDKHPGGSKTARAFLMFCFEGLAFALVFTMFLTMFK